jgi:hypothetical protein
MTASGTLVAVREFMRSLAACEPAVIEEAFLAMVEQALAANNLVIVDDRQCCNVEVGIQEMHEADVISSDCNLE